MKLKFKYTERYVGIFVLIAVLLTAASVVFIMINKKYFQPKVVYKFKFSDARGMSATTPVFFKGFKIGNVTNYTLTADNFIEGDFEVYYEYKEKIIGNSALQKSFNPLTSLSSIEFLQGNIAKVLTEGATIPGTDIDEGAKLLAEGKVRLSGDPLASILANLDLLTQSLNADGTNGKGAAYRAVYNLANAAEKLNALSDKVLYLTDNLSKDNNPEAGAIFRLLKNSADLTGDLKKLEATIVSLIERTDTILRVYSKVDGLGQRMVDPTGEDFIKPAKTIMANANSLLPKVDELLTQFKGTANDIPQMINELRIVLQEVHYTFDAINRSPFFGKSTPEVKDTVPANRSIRGR